VISAVFACSSALFKLFFLPRNDEIVNYPINHGDRGTRLIQDRPMHIENEIIYESERSTKKNVNDMDVIAKKEETTVISRHATDMVYGA